MPCKRRFNFSLKRTFGKISEDVDYLKNEKEIWDKIAPIWEQFITPGAITIKGILFILFVTAVLCVVLLPLLSL